MKRYSSSLDVMAKVIPVLVLGAVAASMGIAIWGAWDAGPLVVAGTSLLPLAIMTVLYVGTWKTRVKGLAMDDSIYIERDWRAVTIPLTDIRTVQKQDDMMFAMRTFGNGGMFGYTGTYRKSGIGAMRWYCTQRKNYVLITTTTDKKIVVTPDEREEFMQDIERKIPLAIVA